MLSAMLAAVPSARSRSSGTLRMHAMMHVSAFGQVSGRK